MLITRLIADLPDWETRLDALKVALAARNMPVAACVTRDWGKRVLELELESGLPATLQTAIDGNFGPVDRVVSAGHIAVPQVFVSDMDSTMIGQECIDELADYAGLKDQIAAITECAMQGELDFEAALRERVELLKGLEETAIDRCLEERIRPNPGARTLVRTLSAKGARTALVTGGFHHFADKVGEWLGFDRVVGNHLDVSEGILTGGLAGPVSDGSTKALVLGEEQVAAGQGAFSIAIGDGANDVPMMRAAALGVAYCAKQAAREAADARIESGDLTALLTLLGIAREEWIED